MPHDDLLKWRDEFPIVNETTYFASHTLGAMPRAVYDKLHEYADMWGGRGYKSWNEGWFELNGQVGDKIGAIMGAPAGSVAVHQNASIANSILLSALDYSDTSRNKVVVDDMIFPSDYYTLPAMLPEHFEIEIVKSHDRITVPIDELLAAIDEHTRLVSISHVLFRSSYIMPVKDIVTRAHEVGAQVLVNGYHSVGIIPVDVTEMNVDFYIGGVLKWMCGGPGGV
ncbi:MAG: aminotransferase class V-fold PLP-dependent enzyme, partial [Chloroflexi bacterium]